jgi:SAM domain (Sterile alpha motif)
MDLGNWLRSLGLERFEAVFRDNAIDEAVLHDLKEEHLRELGLPLGARIKLLKAIAALAKEVTTDLPAGARGIRSCRDLTTGFDHVGTHRHPLSRVLLGTSTRDAEVCSLALIAIHHGK